MLSDGQIIIVSLVIVGLGIITYCSHVEVDKTKDIKDDEDLFIGS